MALPIPENFKDNVGHPDFIDKLVNYYSGYKNSRIYAWISPNGVFLSDFTTELDKISGLKESMQKEAEEYGNVRLLSFIPGETIEKLYYTPTEEENLEFKKHGPGGHAIGSSPSTIEEFSSQIKYLLDNNYKYSEKVVFDLTEDTIKITYKGITSSLRFIPKEEVIRDKETGCLKKWRVTTHDRNTMNKERMHVLVGDYSSADTASLKMVNSFVEFQIEESWFELI